MSSLLGKWIILGFGLLSFVRIIDQCLHRLLHVGLHLCEHVLHLVDYLLTIAGHSLFHFSKFLLSEGLFLSNLS